LRSFTPSLTSPAGTARGQGHGSFAKSVLDAVEQFYADVVQHIKSWTARPPEALTEPIGSPIPQQVPVPEPTGEFTPKGPMATPPPSEPVARAGASDGI
jgi:hypothetical protein